MELSCVWQKNIKKFETNIKERKFKKYIKTKADYTNTVYKWN